MTCRNCGAPIPDGQAYCSRCGTPVANNIPSPSGQRPGIPPTHSRGSQPLPYRDPYLNQNGPSNLNTMHAQSTGVSNPSLVLVMRIVFGIIAAVYLIFGIKGIFTSIGSITSFIPYLFSFFRYGLLSKLLYLLSLVVLVLAYIGFLLMAAILGLNVYDPAPEKARGHFASILACAIALIAAFPLHLLLRILSSSYIYNFLGKTLYLVLIGTLLVPVIAYVLMLTAGMPPLTAFSAAALKEAFSDAIQTLTADIEKLSNGKFQKTSKPSAYDAPSYKNDPLINIPPQSFQGDYQPPKYRVRLQTDRSLLKYIIFSLLTCGIYSLFFCNKLAHDANIVCEGDGEPEVVNFITEVGYNIITFNMYSLCKYYTLANRLHDNGERYGIQIDFNGDSYLLWSIPGSLLCFIGSFVALYKLFNSMNKICKAYNEKNGLD